mmetsp:Transcript_11605/g.17166  ORF Transcript_11605/g.17166 Transcript_11605/m.17166 type:complete len:252 (+) Transcript_11605:190-945(+)
MESPTSRFKLPQLVTRRVEIEKEDEKNHVFSKGGHHDGLHKSSYRHLDERNFSPMEIEDHYTQPLYDNKNIKTTETSHSSQSMRKNDEYNKFRKTVSFGSFNNLMSRPSAISSEPIQSILKSPCSPSRKRICPITKMHPAPPSPLILKKPDAFELACSSLTFNKCKRRQPIIDIETIQNSPSSVVNEEKTSLSPLKGSPQLKSPRNLTIKRDKPISPKSNKLISPKSNQPKKRKKKKTFSKTLADLRDFLS